MHAHHQHDEGPGPATDPVCGMKVDPAATSHHAAHEGRPFHFCSAGCRLKFVSDPDRYLKPKTEAPAAPEGAIFTCPMHPEILRAGPGSCPICGMALEPRTLTAEEPDNPELRDMTRRLWLSAILAAPLFLLTMGTMLVGHGAAAWISPRGLAWLELALATPVVLWGGRPFFE